MVSKKEQRIVLVGGVRTPIGNFDFGGALKDVPAEDLLAICFKETLKRTGLPPENLRKEIVDKINDVIVGNVCLPADAPNIARVAALKAGIPNHITAYTVQRNCASGIESISSAVRAIRAGDGEIFLCGGTENMSRVPFLLDIRWGKKLQHGKLIDGLWLGLTEPTTGEIMGLTAENVAAKYGISREEQDKFAVWSHRKAYEAQTKGRFRDQIVKVTVKTFNILGKPKIDIVTEDKTINPTIDEQYASLAPTVFKKENGTVTPINACPISDGAASVLVMTEDKASELGITPEAYLVSYAYAALDPSFMGEGPIYAVPKALEKAGLKIEDIDFFEINEAFAAQAIPCQRVLGIPDEKLNVWGGAIALGHPVGATGMILTVKMIYILKHYQKRFGLITMCVGGGQGGALVIENYQGGKQ